MEEIWKKYLDFENYMISNYGRCKSLTRDVICKSKHRTIRERILKPRLEKNGYLRYNIYKNNKSYKISIHKMVAKCFIPNPNNYPCINHKDENKSNNYVDNLEWCTHKYNMNYGIRNKRIANTLSKKVNQYDLDGNFIKTWGSILEAREYYNTNHISECCKGKLKQTKGYIWRYAEK